MKKYIATVLLALLVLCLTGCGTQANDIYDENPQELPELASEYYNSIGITEEVQRKAKKVEIAVGTWNDGTNLKVVLPEYWDDIYVLKFAPIDGMDSTIQQIILCDKYSYETAPEDWNRGLLWTIIPMEIDKFKTVYASYAPFYDGQTMYYEESVIGAKDDYVYILRRPTDVQFDETDLSQALYEACMNNEDTFVADFVKINGLLNMEETMLLLNKDITPYTVPIQIKGQFTATVREILPDYVLDDTTPRVAVISCYQEDPFTIWLGERAAELEIGESYVFHLEPTMIGNYTEQEQRSFPRSPELAIERFQVPIGEITVPTEHDWGVESVDIRYIEIEESD